MWLALYLLAAGAALAETGEPLASGSLTKSCGTQPQSTFTTFFHTEGRHIVADTGGERLVFRGVNLTGLEYGARFNNPYPGVEGTDYFLPRTQDLESIKDLGLNVVRLPFEWARLAPGWKAGDALPASLNAAYLAYLEGIVHQAASRQLYVILDMHDFLKYWPGRSQELCVNDSRPHQQFLAHTWKLIASRFRNEPAVLGYDLMNEPARKEPGEACGSCDWHTIAQTVVDAIRTVDGNHLIFVEGPNYSLASHWPAENGPEPFLLDRVSPPRIVYSPHVFFDSGDDSQYDVAAGERMGPIGTWQHYVRDRLLPVIDWSSRKGVPVLIGETGVPCTASWAGVLDEAYRVYFDPLGLSVIAWHYIDPRHCTLQECPLNILACPERHQERVLQQYPGGTYSSVGSLVPSPRESVIYGDTRVNPWDAGSGYWGAVTIGACASSPVLEGQCSMSVQYLSNFDGVKFVHHSGFDTRRFAFLQFGLYLTGNAQQDVKLFTTGPRSTCSTGADPVYPLTYEAQPTLRKYLPDAKAGQWYEVRIPLADIVDPASPVINGVAFQNMGLAQPPLYLDRVMLVPAEPTFSTVSAASFAAGGPLAAESIAAGFGQNLATSTAVAPTNPPLPTALAGRSIRVRDICGTERVAPLWFVSPGQINYLIPEGTRPGRASVAVAAQPQAVAMGSVQIDAVAPGLFTMNADGKGVPAALSICVQTGGAQSWQYVFPPGCAPGACVPVPIDLGACAEVHLQLYGTGIRGRSSLTAVTATIGGVNASVSYAGPVEGMFGLDQVNVRVPPGLAGRGEVDLVLSVDGTQANVVRIKLR